MIAQGMLWMAATAALLALAARALEEVLRSYGLATRWVWVAALVGSAALPIASAMTDGAFPGSLVPRATESVDLAALFDGEVVVIEEASAGAAEDARAVLIERALAVAWPAASLVALALYALTWLRLARSRRGWHAADMGGTRVLLSARGGPAVLGLIRPSIVVPAWLREESAEAQRLILLHEREHVRAGDHALLALAPLFAIAMPWNVALWWQLRRLRLAIEVDCDRRVLARGVSPGSYGALLLDIARRGGPALGAAAALAEPRTFLERRILAMSSTIPKLRLPRALALSGLAAVFAIGACEATTPMNVEPPAPEQPEPEPVATVTEQPVEVQSTRVSGEPLIIIDGVIVQGRIAELDPRSIDHIEVIKGAAAAGLYGARAEDGVILIHTKKESATRRDEVEKELAEIVVQGKAVAGVVERQERGEVEKQLAGIIVQAKAVAGMAERQERIEVEKQLAGIIVQAKAVGGMAERQERVAVEKQLGEIVVQAAPIRKSGVLMEKVPEEVERAVREEYARKALEEQKVSGVLKLRARAAEGIEGPRPLIMIDGVIVDESGLDRLRHRDIERIEIVKGAAAAELYGTRGANGVILITTKR